MEFLKFVCSIMERNRLYLVGVLSTLILFNSAFLSAQSKGSWEIQAGGYVTQIRKGDLTPGAYVQAASPVFLRFLQAATLFEIEQWGDAYLAAGLQIPYQINSHWGVSAIGTFGYYEKGSRYDLGGPYQFRTGIDLRYGRDKWKGELLVGFSHHSNAGLAEPNFGKESVRFGWQFNF